MATRRRCWTNLRLLLPRQREAGIQNMFHQVSLVEFIDCAAGLQKNQMLDEGSLCSTGAVPPVGLFPAPSLRVWPVSSHWRVSCYSQRMMLLPFQFDPSKKGLAANKPLIICWVTHILLLLLWRPTFVETVNPPGKFAPLFLFAVKSTFTMISSQKGKWKRWCQCKEELKWQMSMQSEQTF